jgi:hypothetical protein
MNKDLVIDKSNKLLYTIIDYLFWISLILFTNPGGILQALNIRDLSNGVLINDILFMLLSLCYFIVPKKHNSYDIDFINVKKYLVIYLAYYIIVFAFIVPVYNENKNYSLLITLIKSRWQIYNIFLFIYIYELFKRRWDIFLKLFLYSSIIILIIFIQGLITNYKILPIVLWNRQFININRYLMISYGLMYLLIPLGVASIIFKPNIKIRNQILIGFGLMSLAMLVSLYRKDIIGIIVYFVLAILVNVFIKKRYSALLNYSIKMLLLLFSLALISYLIFPQYINAEKAGFEESVSIIKSSRTLEGEKDLRMTLNKPFINQLFYKHPLFGTGFDNRWRNKEGDTEGYEAADYPLLSALAMHGSLGVLVFLPVYIILIKSLKKDLEYFRTNPEIDQNKLFLLFMTLFLYFVYHLFQYFNYFIAISWEDFVWYFALSLYLAARSEFYNSNFIKNDIKNIGSDHIGSLLTEEI